jgi:large subunit ribosomal protein L6
MSRVGKKMPIAVPQGVDVSISAEQISVQGRPGHVDPQGQPAVSTVKNDGRQGELHRRQ